MPSFTKEFSEELNDNYIARILADKNPRPCDWVALEEYRHQLELEIKLLVYKKEELKLIKKKLGTK